MQGQVPKLSFRVLFYPPKSPCWVGSIFQKYIYRFIIFWNVWKKWINKVQIHNECVSKKRQKHKLSLSTLYDHITCYSLKL